MKFLLLILSVMTFTVQTKSSVSADGTWPYDMDATYSCTYQKGTVRNGDVATLEVSGLGGLTVENVTVYVRSNNIAGAGIFTVKVNGNTVATKSGSLKDWTGAYNSENYQPVSVLSNACSRVETFTVTLTGTANSLYIEKYVITYGNAPARTVTLIYRDELFATLKEEAGGQGVMMPKGPDVEGWWFVGWSKTDCENVGSEKELIRSNNIFYPKEDCTLWAIYKYIAEDEMVYETDLKSGDYLYVNTTIQMALTGVPADGRMSFMPMNLHDPLQVYTVSFQGGDTVFITHTATGTPIGYEGTQLAWKKSPWLIYREGVETLFYTLINRKKYVLWYPIEDIVNHVYYAGLYCTEKLSGAPMSLCLPAEEKEPVYSCYPNAEMGMEELKTESVKAKGEWLFPFGSYNLIIQDGQKRLEKR